MIYGIGTDIIEIDRLDKLLKGQTAERFLRRILHPQEMELLRTRQGRAAEFTAGRFAAKEAVVKALGCGIGAETGFQDMRILPDERGKPVCHLSDAAANRLSMPGPFVIHVSISHSLSHAQAFALVELIAPR